MHLWTHRIHDELEGPLCAKREVSGLAADASVWWWPNIGQPAHKTPPACRSCVTVAQEHLQAVNERKQRESP